MSERAGRLAVLKVSGAAVAFVGEETTASADTDYQITDTVKQVLDRTATINVHKYSTTEAAEAGTTTTNITITGHGLVTGDLIVNATRSDAARIVTYVDDDNVTVAAVTDQTGTDDIELYPTEASTAYTLNRLNGIVTYATPVVRVIRVSGDYLPMSSAAYAHDFSKKTSANTIPITSFLATYVKNMAGTKFASGTLSQWDVTDSYFNDALVAGNPIVIEFRSQAADEPERMWALLDSEEMKDAIEGAQDEIVTFISTEDLLTL